MTPPPGQVILQLREGLGMTRAEFARALDWSPATISRWERGLATPGRLAFKTILAFAEERGVCYRPRRAAVGGPPGFRTTGSATALAPLAAAPVPGPTRPPAPAGRFLSLTAERPGWSAEASFRVSAMPGPRRGVSRPGRRVATAAAVATSVCAILLLGLPGRRHEHTVREPSAARAASDHARSMPPPAPPRAASTRRRLSAPAPERIPPPARDPAPAPAPAALARLDAVVLMGEDRRATFQLDGRPVTVREGARLGTQEVVAIQADRVALRSEAAGLHTVPLGGLTPYALASFDPPRSLP